MTQVTQDFYVTHFERDTPPEEGYVKLPYMTATEEGLKRKIYFMGFGQHRPFNEEYLKAKLKSGSLIKLPAPHKITRDKALWMDTQGSVYIADKADPFKDDKMISVYKPHPRYIMPMPEQIQHVFDPRANYFVKKPKDGSIEIHTAVEIYNTVFKPGEISSTRHSVKEKLAISAFTTIDDR